MKVSSILTVWQLELYANQNFLKNNIWQNLQLFRKTTHSRVSFTNKHTVTAKQDQKDFKNCSKTGTAARCRSVKKLLPGRAESRRNCPKVNEMADIRNTLRVPLTTIIATGRSILLRQSKPRSLTEATPYWLTVRVVTNLNVPNIHCFTERRAGPRNNATGPQHKKVCQPLLWKERQRWLAIIFLRNQ